MRIEERAYRGPEDPRSIGRPLRTVYPMAPSSNCWSIVRFDIRAQRRLGDGRIFGMTEWHENARLWENEKDELRLAALVDYNI